MEDFIKAIGATPVIFSQRNECCGGYMTLNDKELAQKRSNAVVASALEQQATILWSAKMRKETDMREEKVNG